MVVMTGKLSSCKVTSDPDFEYDVIDISLVQDDVKYWIKGFNDFKWKEAREFGEKLARDLKLVYHEN